MEAEHEELGANPFWQAIQSSAALLKDIAKEEAIVCVPASESLKLCKLSNDFLSTHILVPSPHMPDTFLTKNGKTCTVKDGRVICRQGFPRPRTVMVVYEELFYDDDFQSIKILRTNFPLEGKIPMNYYKSVANQANMDVATLNARTLPEHQSVLCRLSGSMYVTNHSFSPEQALANIGASPSPHLTPLPSLPPIFVSLQKFIFSFNTSYVLVKGFMDHAGTKVKDAIERMKEELVNKYTEELALNSKEKKSSSSSSSGTPKVTRLTSMEASAAIEACVFAGIHRKLLLGLIDLHKAEEARTQSLLAAVQHLTMRELGVRPELICDASTAIQHLQQAINGTFAITPLQKLSVLDDVNRLLTQAVDAQLALARAANNDNDKQDTALAADDMLPFWIFLLLQSRFSHIHANIEYLAHFQPENPFINLQQLKVHLANLQGALQFIDSGKLMGNQPIPGSLNAAALGVHSSSSATAAAGVMAGAPRRRTSSTIVTNSFSDLSVREGVATTTAGGQPNVPVRQSPASSSSRLGRVNSQQLLTAIEDGFEELSVANAQHQRTGSSSNAGRPASQRTNSVSYSNSTNPFGSAAHGASSSSSSGLMTGAQHNAELGAFLSSLQQQDDVVTGKLERGQSMLGTHVDPSKKPTWTPAPSASQSSTRKDMGNNVLRLDDADLPPLIVQRTNSTTNRRY